MHKLTSLLTSCLSYLSVIVCRRFVF